MKPAQVDAVLPADGGALRARVSVIGTGVAVNRGGHAPVRAVSAVCATLRARWRRRRKSGRRTPLHSDHEDRRPATGAASGAAGPALLDGCPVPAPAATAALVRPAVPGV